jgi:hypothetical protein
MHHSALLFAFLPPSFNFQLSYTILYIFNPYQSSPSHVSFTSCLLSKTFLATLIWPVLIICLNKSSLLRLIHATRSGVSYNFHSSWSVSIYLTTRFAVQFHATRRRKQLTKQTFGPRVVSAGVRQLGSLLTHGLVLVVVACTVLILYTLSAVFHSFNV